MIENKPDPAERRQYFRIDDTISVSVTRIPADQVERRLASLEQTEGTDFTVMSSLSAITAQMAVHLRRIENTQPEVAAYLKAVDQKLEILGRSIVSHGSNLVSEDARQVNLSAGGICMDVGEHYAAGSIVEIRLLLFPSFTGMLTYGDVVSCEPFDADSSPADRRYHLRVEFTHMREPDRDVLIRHILRRQGDELRARRQREDQ